MKSFVLFLSFLFFSFRLVAQEETYIITETELMRLENISESWERQQQQQLLEIRNLKAKLTVVLQDLEEASTMSEELKSLLEKEVAMSKSLRKSFDEYVDDVQKKLSNLNEENHKLTLKIEKQKRRMFILIGVIVMLTLAFVGFLILKFKFKTLV